MLAEEAIKEQESLRSKVVFSDELPVTINRVAGVDVAYEKDGDRVIAGIVILNAETLALEESSIHIEKVSFPYIPGLFSFRELPPIIGAFNQLKSKPDLIIVDGQGYAHPRRFGLACHLGVSLNIPTIGCAKTRLIGEYAPPKEERGSYSELNDNSEVIGRALRTQTNINSVFVSVGHKVSLDTACQWVLKLSPHYRLPETTRLADSLVNSAMKDLMVGRNL
jgi:deoxyribonuclease V